MLNIARSPKSVNVIYDKKQLTNQEVMIYNLINVKGCEEKSKRLDMLQRIRVW